MLLLSVVPYPFWNLVVLEAFVEAKLAPKEQAVEMVVERESG